MLLLLLQASKGRRGGFLVPGVPVRAGSRLYTTLRPWRFPQTIPAARGFCDMPRTRLLAPAAWHAVVICISVAFAWQVWRDSVRCSQPERPRRWVAVAWPDAHVGTLMKTRPCACAQRIHTRRGQSALVGTLQAWYRRGMVWPCVVRLPARSCSAAISVQRQSTTWPPPSRTSHPPPSPPG